VLKSFILGVQAAKKTRLNFTEQILS